MIINNLMGTVAAGALLINAPSEGDDDSLEGTYPITFANSGAETANMDDWTISSPGPSTATSATGISGPRTGSRFYVGPTAASAEMTQRLAVPTAVLTATDAGNAKLGIKWYAASNAGDDYSQAIVQFYDFDGNTIGSEIVSDVPVAAGALNWGLREWTFDVPVDARSVEAGFRMTLVGGSLINAYIDDIEAHWGTGYSSVNEMLPEDNSAVSGDQFDYPVSFPEPGTYIIFHATAVGASTDPDEFAYFAGKETEDYGFTVTPLFAVRNTVSEYDTIQFYRVDVASGSEGDADLFFRSYVGSFFRSYIGVWFVQADSIDWNNLSGHALVNDTTVTATFTPPENSTVLTARICNIAGSVEGDVTGAGVLENLLNIENDFHIAHYHLTPTDGSAVTITNTQEAARELTVALVVPPADPGRVTVTGTKTYVIVE